MSITNPLFTLRPYQRDAVDAAISWFRLHATPALIVLPTGAGKSLVIAELARLAHGRVLVLAHVKELVAQNHAKYQALGLTADIFSAGLKSKESGGKVVFASVQSVARNLSLFQHRFSLLIVDECHRLSDDGASQYQQILHQLTGINPQLRLLGLTATPYRLGKGWIYQYHYHGMVRGDDSALFRDCIYELPLHYMIKHGYLTPPRRLDMPVLHYDFSKLQPQASGLFSEADVNRELGRQRRITPQIVRQIIDYACSRKAAMIFAATVRHAQEIVALLPQGQAALITGETNAVARDQLLAQFQRQQVRFLVNVAVLTTGFDAPHVDLIAILRPTESVSLYQQMIGRGLRLAPGKADCLILDYAGNTHSLYTPEIGSSKPHSDCVPVQVFCPVCGFANTFWGKMTAEGQLLEHFGRRCQGVIEHSEGKSQCDYRFRFRLCLHCQTENDIAARYCQQCAAVLVDPDDQLKAALQLRHSLILRCAGMTLAAAGATQDDGLCVTYYDEEGVSVSETYRLRTAAQRRVCQRQFIDRHSRTPGVAWRWQTARDILDKQANFRVPDFVIAEKPAKNSAAARAGIAWCIREKLFDYQGRYRRAHELRN